MSIGTIYTELDLDFTKFEKNQQKLLQSAKEASASVEKNWQNLKAKSDTIFQAMANSAILSYDKIAKQANVSAEEQFRAQSAMVAKINSINQDMAKNPLYETLGIRSKAAIDAQKSAILLSYDTIKKSGLASAQDLINIERAKNEQIKKLDDELLGKKETNLAALTRSVLRFYAAWYVASSVMYPLLVTPFEKGFKAVEDYNTSVASLAAMVMSFSEKNPGQDMASQWKEALAYSSAMVPVLENIAAETILSGEETTALANAFARSGVFLDANNAKQIEAFMRISNALPLMTKGQEIMKQINTEIRSVMTGSGEANSMMLLALKAIDPEIEKHLKIWRAQGTVLENIGELLAGFGPATEIIENQWQTVKSTIDTTATQILRGLMKPAYEEIIELAKELSKRLEDNKAAILAWGRTVEERFRTIYNIASNVYKVLSVIDKFSFSSPFAGSGNYNADVEVEKIKKRYERIRNTVKLDHEMTADLMRQEMDAIARARAKGIKYEPSAEVPSPPRGKVAADEGISENAAAVKKAASEAERLQEKWNDLKRTLEAEIDSGSLDDLTKKLIQNEKEAADRRDIIKNLPESKRAEAYALIDKAQLAKDLEAIKNAEDKASKIVEDASKKYKDIMAGEYEFAATENERAINKIIADAIKKEDELTELANKGAATQEELANDLIKINENKNKAILEKETEHAEKVAKLNYDLINQIRGYEKDAYKARIAEIEATAAKNIKDGADYEKVMARKKYDTETAYIDMAKSADNFFAGAYAGFTDLARTMETHGTSGFRAMQSLITGTADAIADFVTTGKANWKSLANSIIRDLVRIAVQEAEVKSIGLLASLFNSLRSSSSNTVMGGFEAVSWAASVAHSGGVPGYDSLSSRSIPAYAFARAPRFHYGIGPGEVASIIKNDEGVFTPGQMKSMAPISSIAKVVNSKSDSKQENVTHHHYYINAVDAKSFAELCRTNPAAITGPMMQSLRDNKTRSEFKKMVN